MKWDKLRLVGASNVDLPVVGADPSGPYILKGVEGLDPPPIDVQFAQTLEEGGVRQRKQPQNRQIVPLVGLQPDWDTGQTSSDLRTVLYGLLTPKYDQPVYAQVMLGNTVVAQAKGDISVMDASIFAKDPEVQISLDCDNAYLLAPSAINQLPVRTIDAGTTLIDINNAGDAPSGFLMRFTLQESVASLEISEDSPFGRKMTIAGPHSAGDTILVETRPGLRYINKIPSGQTGQISILNKLSGTSPWLMLHGGVNRLRINVDLFDWYGSGFTHTPAYWGV